MVDRETTKKSARTTSFAKSVFGHWMPLPVVERLAKLAIDFRAARDVISNRNVANLNSHQEGDGVRGLGSRMVANDHPRPALRPRMTGAAEIEREAFEREWLSEQRDAARRNTAHNAFHPDQILPGRTHNAPNQSR